MQQSTGYAFAVQPSWGHAETAEFHSPAVLLGVSLTFLLLRFARQNEHGKKPHWG